MLGIKVLNLIVSFFILIQSFMFNSNVLPAFHCRVLEKVVFQSAHVHVDSESLSVADTNKPSHNALSGLSLYFIKA